MKKNEKTKKMKKLKKNDKINHEKSLKRP